MSILLIYSCNYNGWGVDGNGKLTNEQIAELENELPNLTYKLHDDDGYNEDGLWGSTEDKVNNFIKSVVGDIPYEIYEDFSSS